MPYTALCSASSNYWHIVLSIEHVSKVPHARPVCSLSAPKCAAAKFYFPRDECEASLLPAGHCAGLPAAPDGTRKEDQLEDREAGPCPICRDRLRGPLLGERQGEATYLRAL